MQTAYGIVPCIGKNMLFLEYVGLVHRCYRSTKTTVFLFFLLKKTQFIIKLHPKTVWLHFRRKLLLSLSKLLQIGQVDTSERTFSLFNKKELL